MRASPLVVGVGAALLAAIAYGSSFALSKLIYAHGVSALSLVSLRFLALLVVYASLLYISGRKVAMTPRLTGMTAALGILLFGSSGGLLSAITFIPVSLAILIFYTYPIFILIIVSIVNRKVPTVVEFAAALTAFIGLWLALEVSFSDLNLIGIGLALLSALCAASNLVIAQRVLRQVSMTTATFYMAASALLIAAVSTVGADAVAVASDLLGWVLLALVLGLYCLAIGAMFTGVRLIGPVQTSMVMCLEPPVAIVWAIVLLGERMTLQQAIGAMLVVAAIAVTEGGSPGVRHLRLPACVWFYKGNGLRRVHENR